MWRKRWRHSADNRTIDLEIRNATASFVLLAAVQVTLIATITVITVALPLVGRDLHVGESGLVLVSTSYGISFGGLLPLGGRLADGFGRRRIFVAGMIIFGLASAGAGLAPQPGLLAAARLAEGAGAALAAPAAVALLGAVFPDPGRRGQALAMWGALSSSGAIAGTVASGVLTTWVSWRWVFAAPAVFAAFAIAAAPMLLPEGRVEAADPVDWPGAVLGTAGLAALIYGVQRSGWAALAGLVLLALFWVAERRSAAPLVPPAFLRRLTLPLVAVLSCAGAMAAAFLLLSLYLQQERGMTAVQTSAVFLLPLPAAVIAAPLAGRLIRRVGVWSALTAGLAVAAAGLLLLSFLNEPYAGLFVFPFGAGLAFSASIVASMSDTAERRAGLHGALVNTAMETGPPLGLAVLFRVADVRSRQPAIGYPFALRAAAVLLLALALFTMLTRPIGKSSRRRNTMNPRFTDKVVLITGGGSGIGRAAALAFAREGAIVAVAGRRPEPLAHTVRLIEDEGGQASAITADVSSPADAARLVHTTVSRHGRLDIAFNNAGILEAGPLADMDEDAWDRQLAVNLTGVFLAMKHEITYMRANGGGVIVNTSSNIGAHMRLPFVGAYAATKAAVSALTGAAAREYIAAGIRINAISPGPMATAMSLRPGETEADRDARLKDALPVGRAGTTGEAAAAVLWLASAEAAFTVGHDLVIDGGATA